MEIVQVQEHGLCPVCGEYRVTTSQPRGQVPRHELNHFCQQCEFRFSSPGVTNLPLQARRVPLKIREKPLHASITAMVDGMPVGIKSYNMVMAEGPEGYAAFFMEADDFKEMADNMAVHSAINSKEKACYIGYIIRFTGRNSDTVTFLGENDTKVFVWEDAKVHRTGHSAQLALLDLGSKKWEIRYAVIITVRCFVPKEIANGKDRT